MSSHTGYKSTIFLAITVLQSGGGVLSTFLPVIQATRFLGTGFFSCGGASRHPFIPSLSTGVLNSSRSRLSRGFRQVHLPGKSRCWIHGSPSFFSVVQTAMETRSIYTKTMKQNKNHPKHVSLLLLGALVLPSCTNTSHAVLYQHSNLGFNTGIDPATANIHTRVGMRREFAAIIPKYKVRKNENKPEVPLLASPDDYYYQS